MRRAVTLYRSSIGKKILMAATGAILVAFVVVHMIGNLKIYQGEAKFNAYAEFLRSAGHPVLGHGQALWIARIVLLGCVGLHIVAALQLWLRSRAARPIGYRNFDDLSFSYASRTMRWGGVIVLGFVVYHLLHLTVGSVHPEFLADSPYRNVVTGFGRWPVALAYVGAMAPLGLHVYHGLWSGTQTLALQARRVKRWRRAFAAVVAAAIVAGNCSIPLAVLFGLVR